MIMDFKVIHIDETDSTNKWMKDYSANAEEQNVVVVADYQTAGKGCGTNSWESERGKNLTFSVLIHPEGIPFATVASQRLQAKEQFRITEVVSVALCKTLKPYIYNKVVIKWPNDIYVGDKKICGILIENRLQGSGIKDCIIGIGLNVNQTEFKSNAPNPVSLKQLTGKNLDCEELLMTFLENLGEAFDSPAISQDYRQRLYRQDGYHDYKDANGPFKAKLQNVQDGGTLVLLDTEGKERYYAFKEVEFLIDN